MKKHFFPLLIAAVWALSTALSACQGLSDWLFDDVDPAPGPTPTAEFVTTPTPGPPANKLFGVAWSEERRLHPLTNNNRFDALWIPLVYEGLYRLDASFQPRELLCTGCVTQDNRTFVFTLRSGVLFHDGTPLTAADALWSLNAAQKPDSPYAERLSEMAGARCLSESTLEVVLTRPNPLFTALLTFPIVPAGSDGQEIAPGTGPYAPVMEQDQPHLTPFADWWRQERLPVSRLELVPITSGNRLILAFESKILSLAVYNPSDITGVRFQGDYETWAYDTPILEYIGFNTAHAPLNDPAVRQALARAVNRDAVGRDDAEPRWMTPAVMPIPPASPLYNKDLAGAYGYDPARAVSLLRDLGYENLNEGGVLVSSGRRPVALAFTMVVCLENAGHVEAARRMAALLTDLGISVLLEELPEDAYYDALDKGQFDLYYGAVTLTADFSPLLFFKDGRLGYGGYWDAQTLSLWEEAAEETVGTSLRLAFWERFMGEAPIVTMGFQRQAALVQRGLVAEPRPVWEDLFANLPEWKMRG